MRRGQSGTSDPRRRFRPTVWSITRPKRGAMRFLGLSPMSRRRCAMNAGPRSQRASAQICLATHRRVTCTPRAAMTKVGRCRRLAPRHRCHLIRHLIRQLICQPIHVGRPAIPKEFRGLRHCALSSLIGRGWHGRPRTLYVCLCAHDEFVIKGSMRRVHDGAPQCPRNSL